MGVVWSGVVQQRVLVVVHLKGAHWWPQPAPRGRTLFRECLPPAPSCTTVLLGPQAVSFSSPTSESYRSPPKYDSPCQSSQGTPLKIPVNVPPLPIHRLPTAPVQVVRRSSFDGTVCSTPSSGFSSG